jgi:phosphopantothenoylcysteine decarboxylase/phosphopantothenate--cysteine ligase
LSGKRIVVGVGGGIAAFKAVVLVRELLRRGAELRVAMTQSATRFVGRATFSGLTGKAVVLDIFDPSHPGEVHVELGQWADAMVVAPATANLLARAALGMADDAVLATLSCTASPVLFAPAMHERMWLAPATQRNVQRLRDDGALMVGPVQGALASGQVGLGRMAEPEAIADALEGVLARPRAAGRKVLAGHGLAPLATAVKLDLDAKTVLVSAGPTLEDIDPVRFISNRSSGRMGFALASAARDRGARVILVTGPTEVSPPSGVELVNVRSTREMQDAIDGALEQADAVIMNAAPADYRPAQVASSKIKKKSERMSLELVKNPDILAGIGARRVGKRPALVGFAMETDQLAAHARRKLLDKKCDLIVANEASVGFGRDDTQATLVGPHGDEALPPMTKVELANRILDEVVELLRDESRNDKALRPKNRPRPPRGARRLAGRPKDRRSSKA